ncbi:MAG: hypothetical protein ACOX5R_18385 [bacterium]
MADIIASIYLSINNDYADDEDIACAMKDVEEIIYNRVERI